MFNWWKVHPGRHLLNRPVRRRPAQVCAGVEQLEVRLVLDAGAVITPHEIDLTYVNGEPFKYEITALGQTWLVQDSNQDRTPPQNNLFSAQNVYADDAGLHLLYSYINGQWRGAGVALRDSTGYGSYQVQTATDFGDWPVNVTFGAFVYDLSAADPHREIDQEIGKFGNSGDTNDAQFVVKPDGVAGNLLRYQLPELGGNPAFTQQFVWQPGEVDFYAGTDPAAFHVPKFRVADSIEQVVVPTPGNEIYRLNVWAMAGGAPTSQATVEVLVTSFSYTTQPALPVVVNLPDGTSYAVRLNPAEGVDKQVSYYTGPDCTGDLFKEILDFSDHTSQITLHAPATLIATQILTFTQPDGGGSLVRQVTNLVNGKSEILDVAPEAGIETRLRYYSQPDGAGELTKQLTNFTDGTSQIQLFASPPDIVSQLLFFALHDGVGLVREITNRADGSSEVLVVSPASGIDTQIQYFTAADGAGELTRQLTNFTDGTSQLLLVHPSATIASQIRYFSQHNGNGEPVKQLTNFTDGTSAVVINHPQRKIASQEEVFSEEDGHGTLLKRITTRTNGRVKVKDFTKKHRN